MRAAGTRGCSRRPIASAAAAAADDDDDDDVLVVMMLVKPRLHRGMRWKQVAVLQRLDVPQGVCFYRPCYSQEGKTIGSVCSSVCPSEVRPFVTRAMLC